MPVEDWPEGIPLSNESGLSDFWEGFILGTFTVALVGLLTLVVWMQT